MIAMAMDVIIARGAARMEQSDLEIRALRPAETDWLTEAELKQLERLRLAWMRKQVTTEEIRFLVMRKREARRREMRDSALHAYRRKMFFYGIKCQVASVGRILDRRHGSPQDLADAVWGAAWWAATEMAMTLVWDVMQEKSNREEG